MDSGLIDAGDGREVGTGVRQVWVTLTQPQRRLRLRSPGHKPGRAEAVFDHGSWAAKHFWEEAPGVWVFEFDEPLPAGRITLRISFAGP